MKTEKQKGLRCAGATTWPVVMTRVRYINRPVIDQFSRDRIEDLGLTEVDVFIKRQRSNKEEEGKKE